MWKKGQVQTAMRVEQSEVAEARMKVRATVEVTLPLPEQSGRLPAELEAAVETAGQELKRELYKEVVERADRELVLRVRKGKEGAGIQQRGKAPYTFKTVFGTVQVQRTRIEHKCDGSQEVPAAGAWATPQGVCITAGLRDAACDAMLEQSAGSTVERIEQRADEEGLLAKSTVLKIVEAEGERLQAAQRQRAKEVFVADPQAEAVLCKGVSKTEAESAAVPESVVGAETCEESAEEASPLLDSQDPQCRPKR
jgi:hypothetical protein